jgi:hypothetical protein
VTRPAIFAAALMLLPLLACGPKEPAQTPEPTAEAPATTASAAPSAEASTAPEVTKPAPASEGTPAEALARDLVKAGGRRIGYSASKKRFVLPMDTRSEGGRGLDLRFFDDEGAQREILRVCQPGECEERLDELFRDLLPRLAGRLEKEGFEPVSAIGWPSGRDELDVSTLGARLHYEKGKLTMAVGQKPPTPLRPLGGKAPRAATLTALYPILGSKLLGVLAESDFSVFKLP